MTIVNGSSYVVVDVYYWVRNVDNSPPATFSWELDKFVWNTSPQQKLDALCVDVEVQAGQYTGNQCVADQHTLKTKHAAIA